MSSNLLSTSTLLDNGFEVSMKPRKGVEILKEGALISDTIREGKLYRLKTTNYAKMATTTLSMLKEENIEVWHKRLAHMAEDYVRKLASMTEGINITTGFKLDVC